MRWFLAALPLFAASAVASAAPAAIQGLWLTDDHKGLVQIAPCGRLLCGTIARVADTSGNAPRTDIHNPDPGLRGRAILGLPVLAGFESSGSYWKGRAYDPKSGKSYRSTLELNPDGTLKVSGCILFICQSQRWTRIR
ncbi:MAG: hypothetical protein QOH81_2830 [Sphingomonadales bacterium]|jgi:uncharacterized protein (DUF2147 family)|nr:hypothetical protein [Sphingomonadales bacterium]